MTSERKIFTLLDTVTTASPGGIRSDVFHVDGHLISVDVKSDDLGAGGDFNLLGGNGKAEVNNFVVGEDATGNVSLSGIALTPATAVGWNIKSQYKYVQVAITFGATGGRVKVTAVVEVDHT